MISASIRFEGPSFFNIVLQPYAEAGKHFNKALFPPGRTSLLGRVGHMGAGILLTIPLINSVFMAIILVGFEPRRGKNLLELLAQLRTERPATHDVQILINYFCPRSLFPVQPQIQTLGTLEPIKRDGIVQAKETYLLMQLCEALYELGDQEQGVKDQLCDAFLRLSAEWGYMSRGGEEDWNSHALRIDVPSTGAFVAAVRARAEASES